MPKCAHIYEDAPKNRERDRVGKQCGFAATNETPYCKFHGGNIPAVIAKARNERYEADIRDAISRDITPDIPQRAPGQPFTELWAENHEKLDPFSLLLWDIRRSGARIEWFDRKIDELAEEKSIWFGLTKREEIGASEFAGTNKTYEARENILVKMQNDERKRLKDLRDEWQNNKFEAAKIVGYGAFGSAMRNAIRAIAEEFALDLDDAETQRRLRSALSGLPDPIAAITAPDHQSRPRQVVDWSDRDAVAAHSAAIAAEVAAQT